MKLAAPTCSVSEAVRQPTDRNPAVRTHRFTSAQARVWLRVIHQAVTSAKCGPTIFGGGSPLVHHCHYLGRTVNLPRPSHWPSTPAGRHLSLTQSVEFLTGSGATCRRSAAVLNGNQHLGRHRTPTQPAGFPISGETSSKRISSGSQRPAAPVPPSNAHAAGRTPDRRRNYRPVHHQRFATAAHIGHRAASPAVINSG